MRPWLNSDKHRIVDMSKLSRCLHLLAAFLSLGAAFAIFIHAGLPNRSDYSGRPGEIPQLTAPEVGAQAPPFTLPTASSGALALDQTRGTITIINFWATWCQPCRREMSELQRLYDNHSGQLRILAVNQGDSHPDLRKWIRQLGLTYDILLDQAGAVSKIYQVRGLPTTFVLDGEQRVRRLYYGLVPLEQLRRDLERFAKRA